MFGDLSFAMKVRTQRGMLRLNDAEIVLLVVDMQNYFKRIIDPIVDRVVSLILAFHQQKLPVVFTQHGHQNPKLDGGMLAEWWDDHIIEGSRAFKLDSRLPVGKADKVLTKRRYSAFTGISLNRWLVQQNIKTLLICGVMTNVCCETTAREAFCRDYRVMLIEDAANAPSPKMHRASILNLGYAFAYIVKTKPLLLALKDRGQ
jgi:isochorismate hydrolase